MEALRKSRIRKGDTVVVVSGRERGKTGKSLSMIWGRAKSGRREAKHHQATPNRNQKAKQGGILEREAPLQISNVMFFCPVTQKPTRIGIRVLEDGRRVRFSKKSNETVE